MASAEEKWHTSDIAMLSTPFSNALSTIVPTGNKEYSWVLKTILLIAVVLLLVWLYKNNYLYMLYTTLLYYFHLHHSKSLPYPSKNFVGREADMKAIVQRVNFDVLDTRIINIVGSPGFGKSTVAIHVGHHMVDRGVIVHYVNMMEFPSMQVKQVLAEKLLESAEMSFKNVSFEKLLHRWARKLSSNTLIILDNCDDTLHHQKEEFQEAVEKLLTSSLALKILMTSRERTMHLEDFWSYKLHELSPQAAWVLLDRKVDERLTVVEKESIANLTGNVPLALQIIGSLLNQPDPPKPSVIIDELRRQPIATLSPKQLPESKQVNGSVSLSYRYLTHRLQKIGRYLANFPGSFGEADACEVLHYIAKNPSTTHEYLSASMNELVQRSLLEYNVRTNRYQYHRLIREFFINVQRSIGEVGQNETQRFMVSFQLHYAIKIKILTNVFAITYVKSLATLDTERHNIQLLLKETEKPVPTNCRVFLGVIATMSNAYEAQFLQCRFSAEELYGHVQNVVTFLDKNVETIPRRFPRWTNESVFNLYVNYVTELGELEEQMHGTTAAMRIFVDREHKIERMKFWTATTTGSYTKFFLKLADYHASFDQHDYQNECHRKIAGRFTRFVSECKPGQCRYDDIGYALYSIGMYERSARLFELSLQSDVHNVISKAITMIKFHYSCKNLVPPKTEKAEVLLNNTFALFPSIRNLPGSFLFQNNKLLQQIIDFYRENGKSEEATILQERLLEVVREIGGRPSVATTVQKSQDVVEYLYQGGNYTKAADIAAFALDSLKHLDQDQQNNAHQMKLNLRLLLGEAKFFSGNFSEGLDYIESVADTILEQNASNKYAKEFASACRFLILRGRISCFVDKNTVTKFLAISYVVFAMPPDFQYRKPTISDYPHTPSPSKELMIRTDSGIASYVYSNVCVYESLNLWLWSKAHEMPYLAMDLVQQFILLKLSIMFLLQFTRIWLAYYLLCFLTFLPRLLLRKLFRVLKTTNEYLQLLCVYFMIQVL